MYRTTCQFLYQKAGKLIQAAPAWLSLLISRDIRNTLPTRVEN